MSSDAVHSVMGAAGPPGPFNSWHESGHPPATHWTRRQLEMEEMCLMHNFEQGAVRKLILAQGNTP